VFTNNNLIRILIVFNLIIILIFIMIFLLILYIMIVLVNFSTLGYIIGVDTIELGIFCFSLLLP